MTPRRTEAELVNMSDEELLAYINTEGFIEDPTAEDFEGRERCWEAIEKQLDLKPKDMSATDFHPNDWVFIGYRDEAMTDECGRMYPATEEDYYECMEDAGRMFDFWMCVPRTDKRATL